MVITKTYYDSDESEYVAELRPATENEAAPLKAQREAAALAAAEYSRLIGPRDN